MGTLCSSLPLPTDNCAFVFIKPHANTPAVVELVKKTLQDKKITIHAQGEIPAKDIDDKKLIDQHYYSIASKATILPADKLPVPADKFKECFGKDWSQALASGEAVNALQACKDFGLSETDLEKQWVKAQAAKTVHKFGGGFYCGKIEYGGKTRYVFNAFFMSMRAKFTAPGSSIYYFSVSWKPEDLKWADFRGSVLGPTDPADGPVGSIRRTILDQWQGLGLKSVPDKGDNGVHASASPFEGLAERNNWLQTPIMQDAFGQSLLNNGLAEDRIKAWSVDPQVTLEDGSKGSIFDALEDMDAAPCLNKLVALDVANAK